MVQNVEGPQQHGQTNDNYRPVPIGGIARTSAPTAVADGKVVQQYFDEIGRPHIVVDSGGSSGTQDVNIIQVGGATVALGQALMAASFPVVIASNQSAIPVSQSGTWNLADISGTISLPTGAATSALQTQQDNRLVTIDGNIANIEALVAIPNQSTDRFVAVGGEFDDTGTVAVGEGQINTVRLTAQRGFHVNLRNASGTAIGVSGAALIVDGSAVTQPVSNAGTFAVQAAQSGTWTNTVTQATGTNLHMVVDSGTITSITNAITVNSHAVTNAGTFAVQATIAAGATAIAKAEDVASADADVGVPAMAIQKATPANTAGTDGDYAMLQMSAGRLWVSALVTNTVSVDLGKAIGTGTHSAVSVGTSSTAILSTDSNRHGIILTNNGTVTVYIQFGATAAVATSMPLVRGQSIIIMFPANVGTAVSGIVSSGTCDVRVVTFTA